MNHPCGVLKRLILGWFYGLKKFELFGEKNSWWFGDVWGMVWGSRENPLPFSSSAGGRKPEHTVSSSLNQKDDRSLGLDYTRKPLIYSKISGTLRTMNKKGNLPTSVNGEPLASTSLNREYILGFVSRCHFSCHSSLWLPFNPNNNKKLCESEMTNSDTVTLIFLSFSSTKI